MNGLINWMTSFDCFLFFNVVSYRLPLLDSFFFTCWFILKVSDPLIDRWLKNCEEENVIVWLTAVSSPFKGLDRSNQNRDKLEVSP